MHRSSTPNYAHGDSQPSEAAIATTLKKTIDQDSHKKETFLQGTNFKQGSIVGSTAVEKRGKDPVLDYLDRDSDG